MDFTRQEWRTLNDAQVSDLQRSVADLVTSGYALHIGTDAQKEARFTEFVVVACLLGPEGHGNRVFYTSLRKRRMSLHQKLFWETWLSTELALELCASGSVQSQDRIHVHLDVSPSAVHASGRFLDQLAGLVRGQGFPVLYKPDAWAASRAADQAGRARASKVL